MQIKPTMRHHLTPVRMITINKSTNTCWWGWGINGTLMHYWLVGMQIDAATVESSMELLQKIKNGTVLWPRNSTSWNLSEESWNTNLKEYAYPCVHCSVICNSQDLQAAQMPINRWVDKKAVLHLHDGILLSCKKKEILPFATAWVGLESIMLSEISQWEKDKYRLISLLCGF